MIQPPMLLLQSITSSYLPSPMYQSFVSRQITYVIPQPQQFSILTSRVQSPPPYIVIQKPIKSDTINNKVDNVCDKNKVSLKISTQLDNMFNKLDAINKTLVDMNCSSKLQESRDLIQTHTSSLMRNKPSAVLKIIKQKYERSTEVQTDQRPSSLHNFSGGKYPSTNAFTNRPFGTPFRNKPSVTTSGKIDQVRKEPTILTPVKPIQLQDQSLDLFHENYNEVLGSIQLSKGVKFGNYYYFGGTNPMGQKDGYGAIYDIKGRVIYCGYWLGDLYHNRGKLYFYDLIRKYIDIESFKNQIEVQNNRISYTGQFVNGEMSGLGQMLFEQMLGHEKYVYYGRFQCGTFHNKGSLVLYKGNLDSDQNQVYQSEWVRGQQQNQQLIIFRIKQGKQIKQLRK